MVEPRKLWGGLGNSMFQHAYIYSQFKKGLIPDIYLQDEKYFDNCKDDIKQLYGVNFKTNMVSLHIRRGDYKNNPFYIDLTETDYYDKAIVMFPGETFLLFCADRQGGDDIADRQWCLDWIKSKGVKYEIAKYENGEVMDLNLMASCKAHIMANSSFSWWASYLGDGKTIAPHKWFADGVQRIILLDEWIKI